ncbi:NADP-dependent 3-hydroxy acid dehydrogenase YdfG [Mucilaginibacter gossypiicola]|uniref:NADP-dependent 3-hydroxy acid dehydrogenase YdfG n=1 Tax=Mucilaginibacter gossypiicola TaxID=551995 RepID=A0A1H8M197_9SPHI|nr:SDR family NAD(P)-dependent oxidoreductase [Mucilaginibacter gossypiicola]SEO11051.1 NADP-dependent 3-hydroxy acid dehydrogenase YdfG [Mucilaginibacter gossypiicola]
MANQKDYSEQNKPVALITGANQGIGLQVAKELVNHGYTVLVGSRDFNKGEIAAKNIGRDANAIQIDITDKVSITAAAARIRDEFGRLDLLINNAAISNAGKPGRTLEEMILTSKASNASIDEVRTVWETNVFGVLAVTQAMLPILLEAPAARIVNVGSGVGSLTLNADPAFPYRQGFGVVYAASKTALNAITLAFAIELEKTNVKIGVASPGFTSTALNNFAGTDTVEEGSRNIVRAALGQNDPDKMFSGPDGPMPW